MVRWNPHVTDYYNIVFVYSNTCGFHKIINCFKWLYGTSGQIWLHRTLRQPADQSMYKMKSLI